MPTPADRADPADGAQGRRLALVVATGTYADGTLAKLRAPGRDASDLAGVLEDPAVGAFEVETALDAPADSLRRRIARFCGHGGPGDLALVYLSCHGVLDDRGRLYYAATDTDRELLAATAIPAAWLNEQLDDCRCRRQILVLDCCHSGAFAKGAKGEGGLALRERFEGRGRVVLTASRATEYSFEGDHVLGDGASSMFTGVLVEGLRSGEADRDRDGLITVAELYDYAYEAVRGSDARQTPTLWTYGAEGGLLVAHSLRGAIVEPAPLPGDLIEALESARPRLREGAVAELADLLAGPDPGRALTARAQLERVAAEDIPRVAAAASGALAAAEPAAEPVRAEPPPAPAPPPAPPPPSPAAPAPAPRGRTRAIVAGAVAAAVAAAAVVALLLGGSDPPTPLPDTIAVRGAPSGVAVDQGTLWVAAHDRGTVSRIDPGSKTETIDVGADPGELVAGEGSVWLTVGNGDGLVRIDPDEGTVTERVDVRRAGCDCSIAGLAIAEGALWVASPDTGTITRRDLLTGKPNHAAYRPGPRFEGRFAVGGGALWAVGSGDDDEEPGWLARIDIGSGKKGTGLRLAPDSFTSGVAYGEGAVWIADAGDAHNEVIRFDPSSHETKSVVVEDGGITGDDIAVVPGAVLVWEPDEGWLTKVDAAAMTLASKRVPGYGADEQLNSLSSELAVGMGSAWVTDPAGDAVHRREY